MSLKDGGEASESSSVVGTGCSVGGDVGSSEQDISAKGSAPSSPPQVLLCFCCTVLSCGDTPVSYGIRFVDYDIFTARYRVVEFSKVTGVILRADCTSTISRNIECLYSSTYMGMCVVYVGSCRPCIFTAVIILVWLRSAMDQIVVNEVLPMQLIPVVALLAHGAVVADEDLAL